MGEKYFRKESVDLHDDIVEYIRRCPICEMEINFPDFLSTNLNRMVDITEEGIWADKRIAIPCCRCLKILEKIEAADTIDIFHNVDFDLYHIKLFYKSIFADSEIITIPEREVIRNLKKFGIIE